MKDQTLTGKVAVITGASRGLGRAMALALADAGMHLALTARNITELNQTAAEAQSRGVAAEAYRCDVTLEREVAVFAEQVSERFHRVQVLVNNAGTNVRKPVTEFTLAEWRQVLDTNLTGTFLMCRSFVPLMKGQGCGRILNIASIMSHVALPGRSAYAASKAGLLGFTRALALELAGEGITVNSISPGPVATAMNTPILQNPEACQQFTARIPLGRWGKETEIAELAAYLCADAAGFITGADIVIDGGWTAQ